MLRKLLGPVFLALAFPVVLAAQSQATTGIIRGTVTDPSGAPVAGASVVLRETQTGFQRQVVSNERGVYIASLLPLGTYDVTARAVGFSESRRTGVRVGVGEIVNLNLPLAAVTLQAVVVEATQPVVEATRVENATRLPDAAVSRLPNNGRNYLNLTLLTPTVAIVQGPDGDELSIGGQKGIHNNVSVDGADFNNPFFGEQRGGQRPPFTFNLDAVQEIVVTASGANAEFGRSSGGFVNVVTKSGTNQLHGSLHYYGKDGAISGQPHFQDSVLPQPDFTQHQFGFTLGGPIKKDRAFFFVAYDQQIYDEVKQTDPNRIAPALRAWMDTAFGRALAGDYGSIARTNDARALLAKVDVRLSDRHNLSLKYNYTWSEQANGTFDVDSWGRSANGLEQDHSNAINGSLISYLTPQVSNEFRFQYSREDRPRPYDGPRSAALGADPTGTGLRPFPDVAMDFAGSYRLGMPFFLPVAYYDTRIQLLNNISFAKGNHFFKVGGEYNRVNSVQTFIGFANSRYIFSSVNGFLNYAANGNYVECPNGSSNTTGGSTPCGVDGTGAPILPAGPVLLYLQQAGVNRSVQEAGTQEIPQTELDFFIQDSWRPNTKWTVNYGLRWSAQREPSILSPVDSTAYAPLYGTTVTNAKGTFSFPSDGTIPSDKKMFQPRIGIAWDPHADGRSVVRASAGLFYARIPGLNLASTRSTDGYRGVTLFGSSGTIPFGLPAPAFPNLFPSNIPLSQVFNPSVFVFDKNFRNPRTFNVTVGYERQVAKDLGLLLSFTHAATDNVTRFINRNDSLFGVANVGPWTGIGTLTTVESSAKSRYNGITVGLKRVLDPNFQFQLNYTLSWDKSDDDNERDPFTFRYARADNLVPEYGYSDRDQRHRFNGWAIKHIGGGLFLNSRVSIYSAQPTSMSCGPSPLSPFAPAKGQRATSPADRNCTDGTVLERNTLRKDNEYVSLDLGLTWPFNVGQGRLELVAQMFNVTGSANFRDPAATSLLFNFDGTLRSGFGDPQQTQLGVHWVF
ncbi:MAG TPA: carboxypeptidase regulatory-like domain-containing protein [Gemmatimonadales bacterium]|nr:carboxypeptidase regulatory-like domain-containing protein [Gemmatimonadales bacterium]